jgi:hypothetical protein
MRTDASGDFGSSNPCRIVTVRMEACSSIPKPRDGTIGIQQDGDDDKIADDGSLTGAFC